MLLIIIMLILLTSGLVGIIITNRQNHKMPEWIRRLSFSIFILGVSIAVAICLIWAINIDTLENNQATYKEILIYLPVIEATDNEYARFDFYQKVEKWNKIFDNSAKLKNSIWFKGIIGDYFKGCERINFYLDDGSKVAISPPIGTP